MTILVTGANGYIGSAFVRALQDCDFLVITPHRDQYYNLQWMARAITRWKPQVIINCAAYTGEKSVTDCDNNEAETITANASLPCMLADLCNSFGLQLVQISTGCLFDEKQEYDETDNPTRDLDGHCGTYLRSKLLAEKLVMEHDKSYVLRIRLPFSNRPHKRNYINKLAGFATVYDHMNSLTNREDFIKSAIHLLKVGAPYGIYHCANPEQLSARVTLQQMMRYGLIRRMPPVIQNETSGCRLSVKKLLSTGVKMRSVHEALEDDLKNWTIT